MLADQAKTAIEQAERSYGDSDTYHLSKAVVGVDPQALIELSLRDEGHNYLKFSDGSAIKVTPADDDGQDLVLEALAPADAPDDLEEAMTMQDAVEMSS